MNYRVVIDKDITFSALHSVTIPLRDEDSVMTEAVHGHDFRIKAIIEGPLNRLGMVIDFIDVYAILMELCCQYQHKFLLQNDPRFVITKERISDRLSGEDENTLIKFNSDKAYLSKRWSFPSQDIVILDVFNTTTEEIAAKLLNDMIDQILKQKLLERPISEYQFELELREAPGCSAVARENGKNIKIRSID